MAHGGLRALTCIALAAAVVLVAPTIAFAQTEAPGFVYARAIKGHLIAINWEPPLSDPDPAITYRIHRAEETTPNAVPAYPGPEWSEIGQRIGRNNTSFCDDSPKKNSTRYWYVVTAQNSTDPVSAASPVNSLARGWDNSDLQYTKYLPLEVDAYKWYIGPRTYPPLEPANVRLSGADSTITVSWDPASATNILRYVIYRSPVSGTAVGDLEVIGTVNHPETEFVDATVEKYRHYWYRVAAVDNKGQTGFPSIEKHFRTVASTSPPSPHTGNAAQRDAETCAVCHQLHEAPGPNLLKTDSGTEVTLCLTCHDGTGSQFDVRREYTDPALASHAVTVTAGDGLVEMAGTFTCVKCHSAHGGVEPTPKLMLVDGERTGNAVCYGSGCHGSVDPAYGIRFDEAFEVSVHNIKIPDPESGTEVKCSTCHQPHASPNPWLWTSSAYRACFQCHAGGEVDLDAPDIYLRITMSSDHDTQHDVLERDQAANGTRMACQNCHNTHAVTAERPLVDPRSPGIATGDQWNESRTTPLAVPDEPGSQYLARYNGFCFRCHGTAGLPGSAETTPWVEPPRFGSYVPKVIEGDWQERVHGGFSPSPDEAKGTGIPYLHAGSGYAKGQTLSCMTCHEPHGTINNYNLRADVPRANGTYSDTRVLLAQLRDTFGEPIPGAFDTRFFCGSCHEYSAVSPRGHDSTSEVSGNNASKKTFRYFPTGCTNSDCHVHRSTDGGGSGEGGARF